MIAVASLGLLVIRWNAGRIAPTSILAINATLEYLFFFWAGMVAWLWRDKWTGRLHPGLALLGVVAVLSYYIFARELRYIRFMVVMLGIYTLYCFITVYVRHGWNFLRGI